MAEKGDVPSDTVSLPPTYAPSEAYTDSPPPAYRRDKSSRVAIVRMVCVTVVASALVVGFFVLASNYLDARSCSCGQATLQQPDAVADVPRAGALLGAPKEEDDDGDDDGSLLGDQQENGAAKEVDANGVEDGGDDRVVIDAIPITEEEVRAAEKRVEEEEEEEEEAQRELVEEEEEEEALQDIMRAQIDHMRKIRLPVDLILGNPALAGRDVGCRVERRQQPLGGGIVSQAIIVTCSDDDDDDDEEEGPLRVESARPRPPLSLLAPIMKMLSARAASARAAAHRLPPPRPMAVMPCPGGPCLVGRPKQLLLATPPARAAGGGGGRPPFPFRLAPHLLGARRQEGAAPPLASLRRGAALPLPPRATVRRPEASGRALPDPVSLPGLRRGTEGPVTHMEMRARPHLHPKESGVPPPALEFGPPRVHTVIKPLFPHRLLEGPAPRDVLTPPRPVAVIPRTRPIAGPPPQPQPQPPPPKFDPSGRSGIVDGTEPDAEAIGQPQGPPQHLLQPLGPPQGLPRPQGNQEERKHHLLLVN